MNDTNTSGPEPKKIGVWTEASNIEAKDIVIPKKSPDSSDEIPTIPDVDDLQDILETEISVPAVPDHKDTETVNTLSEVGGGISGSADSIEAILEVLHSYLPEDDMDSSDNVWTADSLLHELIQESQN